MRLICETPAVERLDRFNDVPTAVPGPFDRAIRQGVEVTELAVAAPRNISRNIHRVRKMRLGLYVGAAYFPIDIGDEACAILKPIQDRYAICGHAGGEQPVRG